MGYLVNSAETIGYHPAPLCFCFFNFSHSLSPSIGKKQYKKPKKINEMFEKGQIK